MLPKLKFSETVDTLASYVMIVAVVIALVVFGMRVERHLIGLDCENKSAFEIEQEVYYCEPYEHEIDF